jgi:hypothetical protein
VLSDKAWKKQDATTMGLWSHLNSESFERVLKTVIVGSEFEFKIVWKGTLISELIGLASSFTSSSSLFSWASVDCARSGTTVVATMNVVNFRPILAA